MRWLKLMTKIERATKDRGYQRDKAEGDDGSELLQSQFCKRCFGRN